MPKSGEFRDGFRCYCGEVVACYHAACLANCPSESEIERLKEEKVERELARAQQANPEGANNGQ